MSSPRRNKIVDLKATKRDAWAEAPRTPLRAPETKTTRLRVRRRKQRAILVGVYLLLGLGLVGGLGLATHAERLAINDISLVGLQQLPPNALASVVEERLSEKVMKIFARKNMFLYPQEHIESSLSERFPRIKTVEVSREALLAQSIQVEIEERMPFAKWCEKDFCYFLDDEGFVFAEADPGEVGTPYIFEGGLIPHENRIGQTFLQGRFSAILHFLELLTSVGYAPIGIRVENDKDFSVSMGKGPALLVPFDVAGEKILADLSLALEAESVRDRGDELSYVDLRFGNRVYYKFKGEELEKENDGISAVAD